MRPGQPAVSAAPETAGGLEAVHAPLLDFFPEVVTECGGEPGALLALVGIAPAALRLGGGQASYRQAAELLEHAARVLARPDFGLLLASRQCREGIEGPLGRVMRHSRYFGDVLELAVSHGYAHSLASTTWLRKAASGRSMLFGHDIVLEDLPSTSQAMEQILLIGHLTAMRLTGGWVRARKIFFRHHPVSPLPLYRRYFNCQVRFDQPVNATLYHEEDLARPVISADAEALPQLLAAIEARFTDRHVPLARLVRGLILPLLASRNCTSDWVAGRLGLHPRTLHRRLCAQGTSFRRIKDELRRDLALYYLEKTALDFTAISSRLGFSEQAVLTRACHRWFAGSPTQRRCGEEMPASPPNSVGPGLTITR